MKEHNGIQRKTLVIHDDLPFLSHVTPYTADEILNLYSSVTPECWNYKSREYPDSFSDPQDNQQGPTGDLTQESTVNCYDSDGVVLVDDSDSDVSNIPIDENDPQAANLEGGPRESILTDAQLISKFKSVLNVHKSQKSKQVLWKVLTDADVLEKRNILVESPELVGGTHDEFLSLHLPLDRARESVQNAYRKTKFARRKRKR